MTDLAAWEIRDTRADSTKHAGAAEAILADFEAGGSRTVAAAAVYALLSGAARTGELADAITHLTEVTGEGLAEVAYVISEMHAELAELAYVRLTWLQRWRLRIRSRRHVAAANAGQAAREAAEAAAGER